MHTDSGRRFNRRKVGAVADLYTCGTWTVIPGREDEFVAAWEEFAQWTSENVAGAGWATLLQDEDTPHRFLTVGPWESREAIAEWRASQGFRERIARIRELPEAFEPGLFRRRAGIGAG
jgi:heme-degrading monooxygenase HmoA